METLLVIVALALGLAFIVYLIWGAGLLFDWASESGFVGVAAYVACWVFLTHFMAVGCIAAGIFDHASD